jgi:hypothetical protein
MSTPAQIITACLRKVPISALSASFSTFKFISQSINGVSLFHEQLTSLTATIAYLLNTLDRELRKGNLRELNTREDIICLQA